MNRVEVDAPSVALEVYGVGSEIAVTDPGIWPLMRSVLPPAAVPCDPCGVKARFAIAGVRDEAFQVIVDDLPVAVGLELEIAVGVLDAQVRALVAAHACE